MAKAIALLSGGLDSTLAILTLLQQNIEVVAITFLTHFGCDAGNSSSCSSNPFKHAEKFNFEVKLNHLSDKFIDIVKNPKYGHGKNMNPCIDCRILMLKEARAYMDTIGADFIATGEVVGQRPMSQRRELFPFIDRQAGVEGLVLRPLSAKLLTPTIAEINGLVDRQKLHAFNGRTRKPQMKLAEELGLCEYPSPAGGCLLTDPLYSYRLKELLTYEPQPEVRDINLLKVGRHFRLSGEIKAIVGRNERENETIETMVRDGDLLMYVPDFGSPFTLLSGVLLFNNGRNGIISNCARITARYSDAKGLSLVNVKVLQADKGEFANLTVEPADSELIESCKVVPQNAKKTS
ncbi:MAG: thiamine biosynthesis protein [Candidatus Magnetoovum sp. WYHC-5]|nr:thiamine biosynthesis protein [Candidatus Magnetoovum sp. WYHC-5]